MVLKLQAEVDRLQGMLSAQSHICVSDSQMLVLLDN